VANHQFRADHVREEAGELLFARTPCPLLDGTRCSVYRDRPKDCRAYPHLHKKQMTTRLLGVLENARVCPIVFNVLERLKAELLERGHDWREAGGPLPGWGEGWELPPDQDETWELPPDGDGTWAALPDEDESWEPPPGWEETGEPPPGGDETWEPLPDGDEMWDPFADGDDER
jgi:hypothetical protein